MKRLLRHLVTGFLVVLATVAGMPMPVSATVPAARTPVVATTVAPGAAAAHAHDEGGGAPPAVGHAAAAHGPHHMAAADHAPTAIAAAGADEGTPPCPDGPPACCAGGLCPMMHCAALPLVPASAGIRRPQRPAYARRPAAAVAGVAASRLFRPPIAAA